ncbi:hypothetical protein N9954_08755 [Maribacter sp.]|nr:hypothetical protein [Maribacter sp.]
MKIRYQRLIIHFLSVLEKQMNHFDNDSINPVFLKLFTRNELLEVIKWRFENKILKKHDFESMANAELLFLIGDNSTILAHTMSTLKKELNTVVSYTQAEVDTFFTKTMNQAHYLRDKPIDTWDEYDKSNYRSLSIKMGTARRVYGIFTSNVRAEDAHDVTSPPEYLFDTKEEAEEELERIYEQGLHKWNSLNILMLLKPNNL